MLKLRALKKSTAMLISIAMIVTLFAGLTMTSVSAAGTEKIYNMSTLSEVPAKSATLFDGAIEYTSGEVGDLVEVDSEEPLISPGGTAINISKFIRTKHISVTVTLEPGETVVEYYRGTDSGGSGKDYTLVIKDSTGKTVVTDGNSENKTSEIFAISYKSETGGKYTIVEEGSTTQRLELYAVVVTPYEYRGAGSLLPPSNITGLTATSDDKMVSLKWDAAVGADSYTVLVDGEEISSGITDTFYNVGGLVNGQEYTFTVRAVNSAGSSDDATVKGTPQEPKEKPADFTLSGSARDKAVSLYWTAARYAASYTVYRDENPIAENLEPEVLSYTDNNLTNGTEYKYKVVAKNGYGETISNNGAEITVKPVEPPKSNIQIQEGTPVGWLESAYINWTNSAEVEKYNVYLVPESGGAEIKLDDALVRYYGSYYRADAVGVKAGTYHFKIAEVKNGSDANYVESAPITVIANTREGYAFDPLSTCYNPVGVGAYKMDGTLKDDAKVLYIDDTNKDSVQFPVVVKGKEQIGTGLGEILKLRENSSAETTPLVIRIIGQVHAPKGLDSAGFMQIKSTANVTLEGVGNDGATNGWSVLLRQAESCEVKNLGIMEFHEDGVSLDTKNYNCWIHNCDIFYGEDQGGDKAKGDGSLDVKSGSDYCTFSYNHFWDSGKASLCGMKNDSYQGYHMTYHHNWFDHSDSRHPRIRGDIVHIYNNYYDGNAKYGVGATTGSNAFVENNVFRNVKFAALISKQGSDVKYTDGGKGTFSGEDGGMIKMYNNQIDLGSQGHPVVDVKEDPVNFDAYVASSRDEKVPDTYKTLLGGNTYNNFDTDTETKMYAYNPDPVDQVVYKVETFAGRVQGGDFDFEFDDSVQDKNAEPIPELRKALSSYKTSLVASYTSPKSYPATDGTPPVVPTTGPIPTAGPTLKPGETPAPTATPVPTQAPVMAEPTTWDFGKAPFTVTEGDATHPDTKYFPQNKENTARYDIKSDSITPENFGGLKHTVGSNPEGQYQTGSAEFEDGFKSTWQIKSNGGSFSFIPVVDGTVKVYAKHGSTDTTKPDDNVTITQGTNSQKLTIKPGGQAPFKVLTMDVVANQTVTISADQNTSYYCIAYTSDKPVPTTKPTEQPTKPTTPPVTAPPADYDYSITGAAVNGSGLDVTVAYSGAAPAPEGILLAAKYDDAEVLTEFKQGPKVSGAGTYKVDGFTPYTGDKYWLYIWNSVDGMKPLCKKYVAPTSIEPTQQPAQPTEKPAEPTQQPSQPGQETMWTFTGEGTITGTLDLGNGLTFKAGSGSEYAAGGEVDGITFPNRIKLGGKTTFTAGKEDRIFTYTPATDGTLTIYFMHASSSSGAARNLLVYQNGVTILTAPVTIEGPVSASVAVKGGSAVTFGGQENIGIMGAKFTPGS